MTIFISYAHHDGTTTAQQLRQDLITNGHPVWQDVHNMRGGQAWQSQLGGALIGASAVVVVLTPDAVQSEYVKWEWSVAIHVLKKPVFPVLILPCSIPAELSRLHYHDLSDPTKYQAGLPKLLRDLDAVKSPAPPVDTASLLAEIARFIQSLPSVQVNGDVSGKNVVLGTQTISGDLTIN